MAICSYVGSTPALSDGWTDGRSLRSPSPRP
jgi:hypothetical protein